MEHQIIIAYAEVAIGFAQCGVIGRGLWKMQKYHEERSLILDEQEARFREVSQGLERQSEVLAELLRQPD